MRSRINQVEANKFILYVNENNINNNKKKSKHVCFPITKFKEGSLTKLGEVPLFNEIESCIDKFKGRQQEMHEILFLLQNNRLVNILGTPGIGKTSLVRNLCHHIRDRKRFEDGIIYISLRGCESGHMFLTRLSLKIQENSKIDGFLLAALEKLKSKDSSNDDYENEKDQHKMKRFICQILKDKEVLLVLDNCEDPLEDDGDQFVKQLEFLLSKCVKIRVLLTSRRYINKLEHHQEMPYHLYSLSPQASIKLLFAKATREIDADEIEELLNCEIPSDSPIWQQFPNYQKDAITLSNHPLILMLGGHPYSISLAAPMLEYKTLKELFQQLLSTNIIDGLEDNEIQSYASLRLSLEISIENLKKSKPDALKLFKFIGLLPGGVNQNELTDMWGSTRWKHYKEKLIRSSLLIFKQNENMLTLLPFMNTLAIELLEDDNDEDKIKYHLM